MGLAIFRYLCISQNFMSYRRCFYHVPLGAIPNCCSIIRIWYLYSELSGQVLSLHRRNSLRRTLYHLHNRETFPYSSKDNFDCYLVIHSQITFVPSCQTCGKAHIRCGTQHGIPYRAYDKSIGDDLRPSSFFCRGQALSLTQLHTLQLR